MVISPADEDYARALVHVLERRVVARGAMPVSEAAELFGRLGFGDARDFGAGLACAQAKGWASVEMDRVRLRQQGVEETMNAGFRSKPYAPSGPGGPLPRWIAALKAKFIRGE